MIKELKIPPCRICGSQMVRAFGRFGPYWRCVHSSSCAGTRTDTDVKSYNAPKLLVNDATVNLLRKGNIEHIQISSDAEMCPSCDRAEVQAEFAAVLELNYFFKIYSRLRF